MLEASFQGGPFEQAGLTLAGTVSGEQALEMNSVHSTRAAAVAGALHLITARHGEPAPREPTLPGQRRASLEREKINACSER